MRIFLNELYRLWRTPVVIIALVIACSASFFVTCFKARNMLYYVQASDYKEAFDNISNMEPNDALELFSDKEFDEIDFSSEAFLYREIIRELREQATYETYLCEITEAGKRITSTSVFADKDSFSYRNAITTSEAYERIKGQIHITTGPSKGIELWVSNGAVNLIIMLILLIMINELVFKDRESGQMSLFFTMYKGRAEHGLIKIFVCVTSAFVVSFIVLTVSFVSCNYLFGTGNILRPVQSVVGLKGCVLQISILEFMVIYYLMVSFAVAAVSILIFFITSKVKMTIWAYLCSLSLLGSETVMYYVIGENSFISVFKEFNLISFLNPGRFLSSFGNVSIWGYPVDRFLFVKTSLVFIIMICIPVAIRAYSVQNTLVYHKKKFIESRCKLFTHGHVSVLRHENYKLFICGRSIWIIIIFGFFQMFAYTPVREYYENEDSVYYKQYVLQYEGKITEDTLKAVEKEKQKYAEIENERDFILKYCPRELVTEIVSQYSEKLKPLPGLEMLEMRIDMLQETGGYIVYDTGYRLLTFDKLAKNKEITLAIAAGIMIVLSISFLFAGDDSIYMDRITSVTVNGRKRLYCKKALIGSFTALVIYCINYVPYYYSVLDVYGHNGLSFPAQSVVNLEETIFAELGFSIMGSLIFFLILRYLVMILGMFFLSVISKKTRSLSKTIVIGLCVLIGPLMIALLL